jgi:hypothetical protein
MKNHFRPSFESLEARDNTSALSLASSALPTVRPATSSDSASLVHEDTHVGGHGTSYRGHTVPIAIIAILIG